MLPDEYLNLKVKLTDLLDSSKSLSNNERHIDGYNSFVCWHINLSVIQFRKESITLIHFHRQIEKFWF